MTIWTAEANNIEYPISKASYVGLLPLVFEDKYLVGLVLQRVGKDLFLFLCYPGARPCSRAQSLRSQSIKGYKFPEAFESPHGAVIFGRTGIIRRPSGRSDKSHLHLNVTPSDSGIGPSIQSSQNTLSHERSASPIEEPQPTTPGSDRGRTEQVFEANSLAQISTNSDANKENQTESTGLNPLPNVSSAALEPQQRGRHSRYSRLMERLRRRR
jgi:hypothetical protein